MIKLKRTGLVFLVVLFFSCSSEKNGPFFGNGFHNGWADQNSVVIWTRLTNTPEMNRRGPKFLVPKAAEHRRLDNLADPDSIHGAQIPEGFALDQMEGACPGMSGDVKLVFYPLKNPEARIEKQWSSVNADKNYTLQWKLEGLNPDTKYVIELEARKNENSEVTASVSGSFRTPPDPDSVRAINFCIVTCHDYPRRDDTINGHKIYKAMLQPFPDFLVHTGDVEYYDKPGPFALTEELMRFKWDRIFALPNQRDFYSQVTTYFMKDDHDVLRDDAFPGMKYGTVSWERGLEIFDKEQFPSNDLPYKTIRWGKDLQIWIMEGRNFRSKNSDPGICSGNPGMHAGDPGICAGNPGIHAGDPEMRSGNPGMRSGDPEMRSGDPEMHAGNPEMRAGNPEMRSGDPEMHSGHRGFTLLTGRSDRATERPGCITIKPVWFVLRLLLR